jgi:hypothetical protein
MIQMNVIWAYLKLETMQATIDYRLCFQKPSAILITNGTVKVLPYPSNPNLHLILGMRKRANLLCVRELVRAHRERA